MARLAMPSPAIAMLTLWVVEDFIGMALSLLGKQLNE